MYHKIDGAAEFKTKQMYFILVSYRLIKIDSNLMPQF